MFKIYKQEINLEGKKIILETGKIARQADGAVTARCGETMVIATVVGAKKVDPETDYFPLSVNYQEKFYAAGKIPGGYFKREARPTESETLISRLIDRPIRPLFPENFRNEVQVLPTVLSYDKENEPDILSIIASSAALAISGLPFKGPIGASRVGFVNGKNISFEFRINRKRRSLIFVSVVVGSINFDLIDCIQPGSWLVFLSFSVLGIKYISLPCMYRIILIKWLIHSWSFRESISISTTFIDSEIISFSKYEKQITLLDQNEIAKEIEFYKTKFYI